MQWLSSLWAARTQPTKSLIRARVHGEAALEKPSLAPLLLNKQSICPKKKKALPPAPGYQCSIYFGNGSKTWLPAELMISMGHLFSSIHESRDCTKAFPAAALGTWTSAPDQSTGRGSGDCPQFWGSFRRGVFLGSCLCFPGTRLWNGTRDWIGHPGRTGRGFSQFCQELGERAVRRENRNQHGSCGGFKAGWQEVPPGGFSESPGIQFLSSESFVQLVCRQYNFLTYCLIESCS